MKRASALIIALCLLVACGDSRIVAVDNTTNQAPELIYSGNPNWRSSDGVDTIIELDRKIIIAVGESRYPQFGSSPSDPHLLIHQFTESDYAWYNVSILNDITLSAGGIDMMHHGIQYPLLHADAFGPAHHYSQYDMGNGIYILTFRWDEFVDEYFLEVNDSAILLHPNHISFTQPAHTIYWRIKPHSMSIICSFPPEKRELCGKFVDLLVREVGIEPFEYPAYGANPYTPVEPGLVASPPDLYLYGSEANFERAVELLEKFTLEHQIDPHTSSIVFRNWRGEWIHSSHFID